MVNLAQLFEKRNLIHFPSRRWAACQVTRMAARASAAKQPLRLYIQFYILHQLSGLAYRLLCPLTVPEIIDKGLF